MKIYDKTVFCFKGYYESDREFIQERYVAAFNEENAITKIKQYSDDMVKKGFDRFVWFDNPTVEIQGVIA